MAADVFRKSYRRFLELRPTHYRWSHLAPQSVRHLQASCEEHWSLEKLADYLHCALDEAEACLRRFKMSKNVNGKDNTAARMRQAVREWLTEVADLDEKTRLRLADDLAKHLGNQLFVAAQAKEDLLKLSMELEGKEIESGPGSDPDPGPRPGHEAKPPPPDGAAPKWGPQWKD